MKGFISEKLLSEAIVSAIEKLSITCIVLIRDKCNERNLSMSIPVDREPEEFGAWRVWNDKSMMNQSHGGFGLCRDRSKDYTSR